MKINHIWKTVFVLFCLIITEGQTKTTPMSKEHPELNVQRERFKKLTGKIIDKAVFILSQKSLYPYIKGGKTAITPIAMENAISILESKYEAVFYFNLSQDGIDYKAAFKVLLDGVKDDFDMELLFIGNTTPSTQLFKDILPHLKSKGYKEGDNIHIERDANSKDGEYLEKWTFFSDNTIKSIMILIKEDDKCGTHFFILKPQDSKS